MRTWDDYKKTMGSESVLFDYARAGDIEAMMNLKPHKDDLDAKDGKGNSVLMLAAYNGHADLTRYLLELGADPNSTDASGNSVVMGTAFKGYLEIVKLLVAHGADVAYANAKGQSALNYAAMFGRDDVASFLQDLQN